MTTTLKVILISAAVVIVGGLAGYAYITQPVPEPSSLVSDSTPDASAGSNDTADSAGSPETLKLALTQESVAEFRLNEVLRGTPTLVIGTTNAVSGNVNVTLSPAQIVLGDIRINARTFKTDSEQRNGAIVRMIFQSDKPENEYIVFKNISFTGLPAEIIPGTPFTFTASGDLTISGQTRKTVFTGQGSIKSDNSFVGNATSTVTYGNWGISVPNLPFLANVEKQTVLTLNFVAR